MVSQVKAFFRFIAKSTNEHGVHSPFVFDLVTQCLYDKKHYAEYSLIENYRRMMVNDNQIIQVSDFGAGSRVFNSNSRKVADIANNAGISIKRAKMLFRMGQYCKSKTVLEIGTSVGLATIALAANNKATITSLEGCVQTANIAKLAIGQLVSNVNISTSEFSAILSSDQIQHSKFDLIYFDGNHQKDATLEYFNILLPTAHNDSVWIFDDIHWSEGMEEAWEMIKGHNQVTVTIDTFQWGLVFFRREQPKEHFVIRV